MTEFTYTPDVDIQVHSEGAIKLICSAFQTHENGLPEWIKNASDEYARTDAEDTDRIIVVIFRSGADKSISVLDFNGMTAHAIEQNFRVWADPEAAHRGMRGDAAVQGGHGNGGKCYMCMMFEGHALIHTVKDGYGSRYGVQGGSVNFGFVPDRNRGRSFEVVSLKAELTTALLGIGVSFESLPSAARDVASRARGFTLVTGRNPKSYGGRIPVTSLLDRIRDHPQMVQTLDYCQVYAINNGRIVKPLGNPLRLEPVTSDPAFPEDRVIQVPEELLDPVTEERVSTTNGARLPTGKLLLRTSDVSMRYARKARHTINYRGPRGLIGFRNVIEFDVQSPARNRIYGECELHALEAAKQNLRAALADSPLSRAVEFWIGTQIQEYAREFDALERKQYDQVEKDELSRMNEALDRWKNQFMREFIGSLGGEGGDEGTPPDPSAAHAARQSCRGRDQPCQPICGARRILSPQDHIFRPRR